jgi:hypothetical protein
MMAVTAKILLHKKESRSLVASLGLGAKVN